MPAKQFFEKQISIDKQFFKEKLEKETLEHKHFGKIEIKEHKIESTEVFGPVQPPPGDPVETAQALSSAAIAKHPEKFTTEKLVPEKIQKLEHDKFYKLEKHEYYEYVAGPVAIDPGGPVEQRLAALEASMSQLVHFIPQGQRPDLSKGALRQEPAQNPEEEKK